MLHGSALCLVRTLSVLCDMLLHPFLSLQLVICSSTGYSASSSSHLPPFQLNDCPDYVF